MLLGFASFRQRPYLRLIVRQNPACGFRSVLGSSLYACQPRLVNGYGSWGRTPSRPSRRVAAAAGAANSGRWTPYRRGPCPWPVGGSGASRGWPA